MSIQFEHLRQANRHIADASDQEQRARFVRSPSPEGLVVIREMERVLAQMIEHRDDIVIEIEYGPSRR